MAALFSVQIDAGTVADANAYVTLAAFKQYHLDRGNSIAGKTDPQIQTAIVRATDYIDTRFAFPGDPLTGLSQATQWPRSGVYAPGFVASPVGYYPYFDSLTGYYYASDAAPPTITGLPPALVKACCEYGLRALSLGLFVDAPAPVGGRAIRRKRTKVDVIETETEYEPGAGSAPAILSSFPAADLLLQRAGLVETGSRSVMR